MGERADKYGSYTPFFPNTMAIKIISILIIGMVVLLLQVNQCGGDELNINDEWDKNIIKKLANEDIKERYLALKEINTRAYEVQLTEEIIDRIIQIAKTEERTGESRSMGEFGIEYFAELTTALGNTRDPRAVELLLTYFSAGKMSARGLVKIGEPAIEPLIKKLNSDIVGFRSSAAYVLAEILKQKEKEYTPKGNIKTKIKKALLEELKNPRNENPEKTIEWYEFRARERADVRINIIRALGHLAETGDMDVIQILNEIAKEDPYSVKTKTKGNKYPVREETENILRRLEKIGAIEQSHN